MTEKSLLSGFQMYTRTLNYGMYIFYINTDLQITRLIGADQWLVILFTSALTIKHTHTTTREKKKEEDPYGRALFFLTRKALFTIVFFFL